MEKLEHFRHILVFEFSIGVNAAEVARESCAIYGDIATGESTKRKWFHRLKKDHFDISDTPHLGRTSGFEKDHLNTLIHNDPRQ